MRISACIFSILTLLALGCGDDDSSSSSSSSSSGEVAANTGGGSGNTGGGNAGGGAGGDMSSMMGGMGDPGGGGAGGMEGGMGEMMGGMGDPGGEGGGEGMGMGGPGMGGDMSEMMGGMTDPGGEGGGEGMGMGGPGMGGDMSEMMGGMTDPGGEGGGEGMGMGGPGMGSGMAGMGEGMDSGAEGMGGMAGMGGMGDMSGMGGGQGPAPKTLAEMANQSYSQGKDKQAIDLIYAAAIADETPDNILARFRWIPGAKRPGLAVRFGLAVNVKMTPRDYKGDAKPIGTEQKLTSGRPGNNGGFGDGGFGEGGGLGGGPGGPGGMGDMSGMGGPGMGGMGGGQAGGIPEELKKYTGDLGEEIAKALKQRVTRGDFGTVLQVAASKSPSAGGGAGMGGGMGPGMGDPGMGGGMGGPGMGDPGMGGMGGGMGGGGGSGSIAPGVVMLGEGTLDQILATAVEEDLDAVIFFDVSVAFIQKNGLVRNTTYVSVHDVSSGRQLKKSVPLVNITMQTERKRAKDQKKPDPLTENVNDFMKTVDMNYKMAKMPQNLTAEIVQQHRLIPLVNSKTISPLKALAEVAFYYRYQLCPQEHRKIAYDTIIGPQMSAQLIAGNFQQRLSAVDIFLDVETAKILGKPPQAENGGAGSPFGNDGGSFPGAGVGSEDPGNGGNNNGLAGADPMGAPGGGEGALPGAGPGTNPMADPAAGAFPGAM